MALGDAPTKSFTAIADATIAPGKPILSGAWATSIRDNVENVDAQIVGEPVASPVFTRQQGHNHNFSNSNEVEPSHLYGDGTDGALVHTVGTLVLDSDTLYQYTSIQIDAGTTVEFNDGYGCIKCQGAADIQGTLRVRSDTTGGLGGNPASGNLGADGRQAFNGAVNFLLPGEGGDGSANVANGGGGGAGFFGDGGDGGEDFAAPAGTSGGGVCRLRNANNSSFPDAHFYHLAAPLLSLIRAAGGGEGGDDEGSGTGGNGGDGGGNLILLVGGDLTGSGTGLVHVNGTDGSNGSSGDRAGGGGGGAGYLFVLCGGEVDDIDLEAQGGDGGNGTGGTGGGGGGGGGMIRSVASDGHTTVSTDVTGGAAGTADSPDPGEAGDALLVTDEPPQYWT